MGTLDFGGNLYPLVDLIHKIKIKYNFPKGRLILKKTPIFGPVSQQGGGGGLTESQPP